MADDGPRRRSHLRSPWLCPLVILLARCIPECGAQGEVADAPDGQADEDLPIVPIFSGSLLVDVKPICAVGARVVARHPLCGDVAWFPAEILEDVDELGNITVLYGREEDLASNLSKVWTNATSVSPSEVYHYACRDEDWPDGDVGRGFDYVPRACNGTGCSDSCRVEPPTACEQGEFIPFGENCTVRCSGEGAFPSAVNVTCDPLAQDMVFQCQRLGRWCENNGGGNGSANGSNELADDCVFRRTTTTTTTAARAVDRYLRGCSELQPLAAGELDGNLEEPAVPIGMPEVLVSAAASYLEIELTGVGDRAGWVDVEWAPDRDDRTSHEWLTPPAAGPVIVGIAVRFLGDETAEVHLSVDGVPVRDSVGRASQRITFKQALMPLALLRNEASWYVPYRSWRYDPPVNGNYEALTGRPYPDRCRWPMDYQLFTAPPQCGVGFELLNKTDDCDEGAFQLGLSDTTSSAASYPGWPPGCFYCVECDLAGDLYLNTAQRTSTEVLGQAPETGAVCRRLDLSRTSTTTTVTLGLRTTTTIVPPRFRRFASGSCSKGYEPILDEAGCEEAALDLELDDSSVRRVVLANGETSTIKWPAGCFQCLACDGGSLYLNEVDVADVHGNGSAHPNASGDNLSHASVSNASGDAGNASGSSATRLLSDASSVYAFAEPLCRAPSMLLSTAIPGSTEAPESTTQSVIFQVEVPDYSDRTSTTALSTTTTTVFVFVEVDPKGLVTCEDPYMLPVEEEELPAWVLPLVFAGSGCAGCCCLCCGCLLCWIFGICDWIYLTFSRFMDRHPALKRSILCRCFYCFCRCTGRMCFCFHGVLEQLSPRLSPRHGGLSPRFGGLSPRGNRMQSVQDDLEQNRGGSKERSGSKASRSASKASRRSSKGDAAAGVQEERRSSVTSRKSQGDGRRSSTHSRRSEKSRRSSQRSSESLEEDDDDDDDDDDEDDDDEVDRRRSKASRTSSQSRRSSRASSQGDGGSSDSDD